MKARVWIFRISGAIVTLFGVYLLIKGYESTIMITLATLALIIGIALWMTATPQSYNSGSSDTVMMIEMEDKPRKIEDFYEAYKEVETPLGSPWLGEFYTMRQKALVFGPNEKDEYLYFWLTRNGTVGYLGYSFLRKFIKKQLTKPVIPFKKKKQNREEDSYSSNLSASLFQQELKNNLEYFVKTGQPQKWSRAVRQRE